MVVDVASASAPMTSNAGKGIVVKLETELYRESDGLSLTDGDSSKVVENEFILRRWV